VARDRHTARHAPRSGRSHRRLRPRDQRIGYGVALERRAAASGTGVTRYRYRLTSDPDVPRLDGQPVVEFDDVPLGRPPRTWPDVWSAVRTSDAVRVLASASVGELGLAARRRAALCGRGERPVRQDDRRRPDDRPALPRRPKYRRRGRQTSRRPPSASSGQRARRALARSAASRTGRLPSPDRPARSGSPVPATGQPERGAPDGDRSIRELMDTQRPSRQPGQRLTRRRYRQTRAWDCPVRPRRRVMTIFVGRAPSRTVRRVARFAHVPRPTHPIG
jgi:hypothetical protein